MELLIEVGLFRSDALEAMEGAIMGNSLEAVKLLLEMGLYKSDARTFIPFSEKNRTPEITEALRAF
jgi:hypothetical protein